MFYIKGKLKEIIKDEIIFEADCIGYSGKYIGNDNLKIGDTYLFYHLIYSNMYSIEDIFFSDREYFKYAKSLLAIKNIGIKTIRDIFLEISIDELELIFKSRDCERLAKIKNISIDMSKKIINEMNVKLFKNNKNSKKTVLIDSLKKLGYKSTNILKIIDNLDFSQSYNSLLKVSILELGKIC
ncbi:hypothetical protein [Spiroplasma endosymbiont of Aspidapion aeneum]|uniref:hypothetical protein n=1 Tax=Spiroplasma endosymbiont of Aspidapion aeneum TaxID=3066276 RepID=UPI00313BD8D5